MHAARYNRFLTTPGVARLFGCTLVGRLSAGMLSLAFVLRLTQHGRSYAVAGAVTGVYTLASGVSAPVLSRLVDRFGYTIVLFPSGLAVAGACVVDALIQPSAAMWLLLAGAALVGGCMPPLATASRSIWPSLLTDADTLEAAYVTDATFQEVVFIVGPLLVVSIDALADTAVVVIAAGVLTAIGTLGFALADAARRWRAASLPGPRRHALHSRGIRVLVVTMFAVICGFGATEVAIVAAARAAHHAGSSGLVLAAWSAGSLLGGLVYGARRWRSTVTARVVLLLGATTVLTGALAPMHQLVLIGLVVTLSGANCAPALSGIYHAAQAVALPGVVTESYAWIGVGTLVGSAGGTALAGVLITQRGPGAGFVLAAVAVALGALVVALGRRSLQPPVRTV